MKTIESISEKVRLDYNKDDLIKDTIIDHGDTIHIMHQMQEIIDHQVQMRQFETPTPAHIYLNEQRIYQRRQGVMNTDDTNHMIPEGLPFFQEDEEEEQMRAAIEASLQDSEQNECQGVPDLVADFEANMDGVQTNIENLNIQETIQECRNWRRQQGMPSQQDLQILKQQRLEQKYTLQDQIRLAKKAPRIKILKKQNLTNIWRNLSHLEVQFKNEQERIRNEERNLNFLINQNQHKENEGLSQLEYEKEQDIQT